MINQGLEVSTPYGETIDIVPTIANLLGFDTGIPGGLLSGEVLTQALV